MVLSSQHNHNTEGFYLSTLKNRPKPFIDKDSSRFLKLELFLYIIKIRKNSFPPFIFKGSSGFFHALPLAFFITRKKPFPFCVGTCALQTSQRRARRGKNPLRGPPWSVYLKGSPTQKDYVFFCVIKSARF